VEVFARRTKAGEHRFNIVSMQGVDNFRNTPRFATITPLPEAIGKQKPNEKSTDE
jgi:hypothetical protein